jgi:hypothetical protein
MREGTAWTCLRKLLDAAQDTSLVSFAFDAHAAASGQLRELAVRGTEALRSLIAAEIRMVGDTFVDPHEVAWYATRDQTLARLFSALGLDARMRRHPRPLNNHEKAEVLRVLAGEVERAEGTKRAYTEEAQWREDLLRGVARAALQLYSEGGPQRARSTSVPRNLRFPDAKLLSLLNSGSARAILARLQAMLKTPHAVLGIRTALARILPSLAENRMRLGVFVQVLQALCKAPARGQGRVDTEHATLAAAVAEGILAAGLRFLPYESADQLAVIRQSPYLTFNQRQALADLMVPAGTFPESEPQCMHCTNAGIDAFGKLCDCPYGQAYGQAALAQSWNDAYSTSTPSSPLAQQRSRSLPSTPRTGRLASRQLRLDPSLWNVVPPFAEPFARSLSPLNAPLRSVSPSHRSHSPRFPFPASPRPRLLNEVKNEVAAAAEAQAEAEARAYMNLPCHTFYPHAYKCEAQVQTDRDDGICATPVAAEVQAEAAKKTFSFPQDVIDDRPARPYDEKMRPWIPADDFGYAHDGPYYRSQHLVGETHYLPWSARVEHDDRALGTLINHSPRLPWAPYHQNHCRYAASPRMDYSYPKPEREIMQDAMDDRTLRRLSGYDNYQSFKDDHRAGNYSARLTNAAMQFRRLAAGYDNIPRGADLDFRTASLLNP